MSADALPMFVRLPGDIVGTPPYRATGCLLQAVFLPGDRAAQQSLCDQALNRPSGGKLIFHAVTDQVLMTAIYADSMGSTNPLDASKGVIQEWDVGFWTAVHGGPAGLEDDWQTYWLPSFLFVDSPSAMASGKEIFGYPKTAATFADRTADHADPTATIIAQHFPVFGPGRRPVTEPLVRIRGQAAGAQAPSLAANLETAWSLVNHLADPLPPIFHSGFHLPPMPSISMPQIMLRQFQDPVALGRASLQSILYVAPKVLKIGGVGVLHSPVVVEITASASHPIMETLGLAPRQVGELGFWVQQDFEVDAARKLY